MTTMKTMTTPSGGRVRRLRGQTRITERSGGYRVISGLDQIGATEDDKVSLAVVSGNNPIQAISERPLPL